MKLEEFANEHLLKLESVKLLGRTDWEWEAHHYQCRLTAGENGREFLFSYSKGTGLRDGRGRPARPQLAECLECLHSDMVSVSHGPTFEEWAGDVGYDTDSRKAFSTYQAMLDQQGALREFMGSDFRTFLECEGE